VNRVEKTFIGIFIIVSMIMFSCLLFPNSIGLSLFNDWIHFPFYGLSVILPFYWAVKWIKAPSRKLLLVLIIVTIPGFVFTIWFVYFLIQFGKTLSEF
jgi:hypothetical protein